MGREEGRGFRMGRWIHFDIKFKNKNKIKKKKNSTLVSKMYIVVCSS